jgi:hypothetical protein
MRSTRKPPSSAPELALTGAEFDPAVREQVEGGHALGYPGGMIHPRRDLDDAVAEPDLRRARRRRRQEHLRSGGMAVFLHEVMLDLPDVVEAHPVGDLDLLEGVLQQPVLRALGFPRTRVLVLVEDAEAHARSLSASP